MPLLNLGLCFLIINSHDAFLAGIQRKQCVSKASHWEACDVPLLTLTLTFGLSGVDQVSLVRLLFCFGNESFVGR